MYTWGQILNALGILCEGFAVIIVFRMFPTEKRYYEEAIQDFALERAGIGSGIEPYEDKRNEILLLQGSVALGLFLELIATFL